MFKEFIYLFGTFVLIWDIAVILYLIDKYNNKIKLNRNRKYFYSKYRKA